MSPLDCIYVSSILLPNCMHWEISDKFGELTDHQIVSTIVNTPNAPHKGKGRYTMNLRSLENEKLMDSMIRMGADLNSELEILSTTGQRSEDLNPQVLLHRFKDCNQFGEGVYQNQCRNNKIKNFEAPNRKRCHSQLSQNGCHNPSKYYMSGKHPVEN
jgi:hypothetical protein